MVEAAEYCRQIEAYLCRKNEGHLIRIVGPVFEQVTGWAAQGVPLAIAFQGIDRYCERYYAKGPRRRPVRVEFCEADVLELFDDWRRAVGVTRAGGDAEHESAKRDSLPAHLDRVIARLTALRAGGVRSDAFHRTVDAVVRELDGLRTTATHARGDARSALVARLGVLDRTMLDAAHGETDDATRAALRAQAEGEVAPFAARMPANERERAATAAFDRLVRDAFGLPVISHEP